MAQGVINTSMHVLAKVFHMLFLLHLLGFQVTGIVDNLEQYCVVQVKFCINSGILLGLVFQH